MVSVAQHSLHALHNMSLITVREKWIQNCSLGATSRVDMGDTGVDGLLITKGIYLKGI
jgi:hypothetical protein